MADPSSAGGTSRKLSLAPQAVGWLAETHQLL